MSLSPPISVPVRSKKATLPLSPSNPPPVPQSTASRMCHLKVMLEDDYNDDDEGTGDSGVGTGTGSAECGDRSVWKSAMKRPPSGMCTVSQFKLVYIIHLFVTVKPKKKRYATLREETAQEGVYTVSFSIMMMALAMCFMHFVIFLQICLINSGLHIEIFRNGLFFVSCDFPTNYYTGRSACAACHGPLHGNIKTEWECRV